MPAPDRWNFKAIYERKFLNRIQIVYKYDSNWACFNYSRM